MAAVLACSVHVEPTSGRTASTSSRTSAAQPGIAGRQGESRSPAVPALRGREDENIGKDSRNNDEPPTEACKQLVRGAALPVIEAKLMEVAWAKKDLVNTGQHTRINNRLARLLAKRGAGVTMPQKDKGNPALEYMEAKKRRERQKSPTRTDGWRQAAGLVRFPALYVRYAPNSGR
jgi:hypothetical protein